MKKKTQIGIYKINTDDFQKEGSKTSEQIIDAIISEYCSKPNNPNYKQPLFTYKELTKKQNKIGKFDIRVFRRDKTHQHMWDELLKDIIEEPGVEVKNSDFILFAYDNEDIFCTTSNKGFKAIEKYVDDTFPIEVIKRISDPNKIRSASDRALTGSVYATTQYFRNTHRYTGTEMFGKILKNITVSINKQLAESEEFADLSINKKVPLCDAKSSFKLRKEMDILQVIELITKLQKKVKEELTVDQKSEFNFLNGVIMLGSKHIKLKQKLREEIYNQIFLYLQGQSQTLDLDFCHSNYEIYLSADRYKFQKIKNFDSESIDNSWQQPPTIEEIVVMLKSSGYTKRALEKGDFNSFMKKMEKLKFHAVHDGVPEDCIVENFFNFLQGEIVLPETGQSYFLIDKNLYQINPEFLKMLDEAFGDILKNTSNVIDADNFPILGWNTEKKANKKKYSEGNYNEDHFGISGFILGDRIFANNIELFDFMYIKGNEIFLFHNKVGFGSSMRDVCSQIQIAAKILEADIKGGSYPVLKKLYKSMLSGTADSLYRLKVKAWAETITEEKFIGYFVSKKITFVLGFYDETKSNIAFNYANRKHFRSNIARLELLNLIETSVNYSSDFKIVQIPKAKIRKATRVKELLKSRLKTERV